MLANQLGILSFYKYSQIIINKLMSTDGRNWNVLSRNDISNGNRVIDNSDV